MAPVHVQKIQGANESQSLLQETTDLLNSVQTRAFELFERRGGSRDIRNQYTIGYVPTNGKHDGTYHNVRLKLTGDHADQWIVRTRPGYFAAPPDSALTESQKARER